MLSRTFNFSKSSEVDPDLQGRYKHLTQPELHALQQLWEKLFDRYDVPINQLVDQFNNPVKIETFGLGDPPSPKKNDSKTIVFNGCKYGETVQDKVPTPIIPVKYSDISSGDTLGDYIWEAFREDIPDTLALKFLRARKWNVDDALDMILSTLKWRYANKIDEIIFYGESLNDASIMYKGTAFVRGVDKLGHPIVWAPITKHFQKDQDFSQSRRYIITFMESVRQLLQYPKERICLVIDLSDQSNRNTDWPFTRMFLKLLEAYYPECLALAIVYNGPWWFGGIFRVVSTLIDAEVSKKIHFVKNPNGLLKFINKDQLPKSKGGTDNYDFKYILPVPHENDMMSNLQLKQEALAARNLAVQKLVSITHEWIQIGKVSAKLNGDLAKKSWYSTGINNCSSSSGSGRESSETITSDSETSPEDAIIREMDIQAQREEYQEAFATAARNLDRFTRARNIYHRNGMIPSSQPLE
ncbi:CRAL-TRIO domain-containing protein [Smittium mucronatum]|uniref:CRAL-TRIO domain-containing protein n=1 Tax=Smittium mucronatum TaxID=133383 RepID=A0A1R0H7M8_9FUNG|nr:CRAL-TRIO domain-containing protein [Smittium mucronatum]